MSESIYNFQTNTLQGQPYPLSQLEGKVVLIVNTASKCGLTPQYEGLQQLHEKYHDKGLVILGFPCNQFGQQEPGSPESIQQGCLINYGVSFPMMEKIDVNGKDAHPLYQYLKTKQSGLFGSAIKWNFTKFLVNRSGNPVKRFAPTTKPDAIEKEIEKLLS
ncbi:glutathione peroxidase [Pseudoalteromonas xiamenensis]|uniref:Glutathione peroxidase n=1 Tax=Pseudoalteromonas xiamenensis TaxID=882626 RepID=A0A975DF81_9GAMM|nr:glutathione peroxidase [Pseudoalteromonas xiamenensis]QTH70205.1 glutathione peroxidase [Pseudoalteromonas xiamenensis]